MYFIPKFILCLFFLIIVDFFSAKAISEEENLNRKKNLLLLSLISNFGLLFYFKYFNFFIDILLNFNSQNTPNHFIQNDGIIPIGLSFHTFQSVSYVIDVYRGKLKPEKHIGIYSTYVLFFPQMVAGPIERFSTLGNELKKVKKFELKNLQSGVHLIIIGLFYKMVIADNVGEYVNIIYSNISNANSVNVLFAVLFFSLQIYCDFFGYSLIAQGSAKLLGIELIDNFKFPFFSENLVEFWKTWHISLTSWFREYLYIPLGGNRTSNLKHKFNLIIVFLISGLWHGAGYNFILWGMFHGIFYILTITIIEKIKKPNFIWINRIFTFLIVSFIFIFFRTGKVSESISILEAIFNFKTNLPFQSIPSILIFNILALFTLEYNVLKYGNYHYYLTKSNYIATSLILYYLLYSLFTFSCVDNLPFIYFQF